MSEYPGQSLEVKQYVTISVQDADVYTLLDGVREYLSVVNAREWSEKNHELSCLFTFLEEELRQRV